MHALLIFLALCQDAPPPEMPVVEQSVEAISVAHLPEGIELVFFWDLVQNDWTCLDHRWLASDMAVSRDGDGWILEWEDDSESCYRSIRAACYVESWENESPLAEQNQRPWFRQLLNPGLRQPGGGQ